MRNIISLILVLAGLAITIIGIISTQQTNADLSPVFTGAATDKAVLTIILGSIVAAIGLTFLVRAWRRV